tara:strand:- start:545 stop:763 length:219 start_codon:yes stop_codon:yes gene_type:complete
LTKGRLWGRIGTMSKTNKAGKLSMRTRFEEFRNNQSEKVQARANDLWSNKGVSNLYKIKAKLKKEFGDEVKA